MQLWAPGIGRQVVHAQLSGLSRETGRAGPRGSCLELAHEPRGLLERVPIALGHAALEREQGTVQQGGRERPQLVGLRAGRGSGRPAFSGKDVSLAGHAEDGAGNAELVGVP